MIAKKDTGEKRLNPYVSNFLNFWRPSLGRRFAVYFTVFGIIIGYFVLAYSSVASTRTFIKTSAELIRHHLSTLSKKAPGDEILKLLNEKGEDIRSSARFFKDVSSQFNFDLYFQDSGGQWQHMFVDQDGVYRSNAVLDVRLVRDLESARRETLHTSSVLFFGKPDKVNVKVNTSPKGESLAYILDFTIDRQGILKIINDNLGRAIIFFIVLLLASNILGHLFGYMIARPITRLSKEAAVIASGRYEHMFATTGKDEIGVLVQSLNSMASRLIEGAKEREDLLIGILIALSRAIDAKSGWTAGHSERVLHLVQEIGHSLRFDEERLRVLCISAILHDIGKIAVPEQILDKPGKLTDEEFNEIKKHPGAGAKIISSIPSYDPIISGILHHHEHWDGSGYPHGLKGELIPINARIICVADVYDALVADRPYRKAWSNDKAIAFFKEQKGKTFDPDLVDVFFEIMQNR